MFIFYIDDKKKRFWHNGRLYNTPCTVSVSTSREIDILNNTLKENKIEKIKVENKKRKRQTSKMNKIPIIGTGQIRLSASLG